MSAYVIAQIDIEDPEKFEKYRTLVPPIIERLEEGMSSEAVPPKFSKVIGCQSESSS